MGVHSVAINFFLLRITEVHYMHRLNKTLMLKDEQKFDYFRKMLLSLQPQLWPEPMLN